MTDTPSTQQILDTMRGASATLWSYNASLHELTLRLEQPGTKGNLHVIFNACLWVQGPTTWLNADLECLPPDSDTVLRIKDRHCGFAVHCRLVRFARNVEPVFAPEGTPEPRA